MIPCAFYNSDSLDIKVFPSNAVPHVDFELLSIS